MLTIFTIPKAFRSHINIIQRNAIKSWLRPCPQCEVILFGDEEGVAGAAAELGVKHVPGIEKNEFGTPLLNWAFNFIQKSAKNDILVYANSDIILMSDFISAVQQINLPLFLMTGRRWDLDIKEEIDFDDPRWEKKIRNRVRNNGKLHGPSGIDYLIFPRHLPHNLPPFAVGRVGWDNWLIYHIRSLKIPVIDATEAVTVVHQNHDFSHSPWGEEKKKRVIGPEVQKTLKLAGGFSKMLTLRDADWILTLQGLKKPKFPRNLLAWLSLFYPWRLTLSIKRNIQQRICNQR